MNKENPKRIIISIIIIIILIMLLFFLCYKKEYTVTLKYYEDNQKIIETKNQKISKPEDPELDGYTFIGWYENNQKFDFNKKINKDITLVAKWEKIPISNDGGNNENNNPDNPLDENIIHITFNSNGGSNVPELFVKKGSIIAEPDTPIREGYEFKGWYNSANILFDFTKTIDNSITLYAIWQELPKESPEDEPSNNNTPQNPNKEYVTITFNSNGGSSISKQTIEKGKKASKPANPSKEGYNFLGWYTIANVLYNFNETVNSNITLYAKWETKTKPSVPTKEYVTVSFNTNGGTTISSITVEKGNKISKPANPTKSGYTFVDWYTNGNLTETYNFNNPVNSNITLYAKWQKIESSTPTPSKQYVTVTFNTNGGSVVSSKKIEKGSTVSRPANPTRSGYEFVGWYNSARTEFNFSTKINSDTVLSAVWAPKISYTKDTSGKFIFINNPESLVLESYLADTGKTSLYTDKINGNTEIFYSHNVTGPLSGKIYYAFRVYNPSSTKTVTLTVNNCGITSSWDNITVWEQYYYKTCNSPTTLSIKPGKYKYIFHNDNKFTFGDEVDITNIKKPTSVFHGVLNVTTNGELAMATIAFKDIKQSYSNPYLGNFEGKVTTNWTNTLDERFTSGNHQGLPVVTNNLNVEIYNETPKGNLKVSYVNPEGTTKVDNGWVSNFVGARIINNKPQILPETQTSDILDFQVPKRNKGTVTYGAYPRYKETGTAIHPTLNISIKDWPYSLANWGVHYNENITIKNNSNSDKSVSFILTDAEAVAIYYNNRLNSCKNDQPCTVWTVTVKAHQTLKVPAILTLATNTNDYIGKKIVLNN